MRKIVAMAVICLTDASGLTSAYAAQLADDEAGLRIRLKNELRRADKPSAGAGRDIYAWVQGGLLDFNSGYYSNIIGVEGGAYYVYKLGARADMSTRWYLDGDKSFGFALGAVKIKPSENSLLKLGRFGTDYSYGSLPYRIPGISYIYVTQHIGMMKHISDQVLVMHQGEVVERGSTADVLASPLHELTKRLIAGHFGEALTADAWRKDR